jgi:hypothetical protein
LAQQYRYIGINAVITFNDGQRNVILSNDYTDLGIELTTRLEDKTAGNDQDQSFNPTIREGKATLKGFDTGENGVTVQQILREQTFGYLSVWTKGQLTGKPKFSMPVIVKTFKMDIKNEKNVTFDVEFAKSGAVIDPMGTLQYP